MKIRSSLSILMPVLVSILLIVTGCTLPSGTGIPKVPENAGIDLRYRLYGPAYGYTMSGGSDESWAAKVNMTNAGTRAADGFCVKLSLINKRTGAVEDRRTVQTWCGTGCPGPGEYRIATVTFSPGRQDEGYYRITGESCGGEWAPVTEVP